MNDPDVLSPSIRGITYPLTVENGNLTTSVDYALTTQQIRSVVETRYFERVMRAEYGIGDYVLEIIDPGQINSAIQFSILQNVAKQQETTAYTASSSYTRSTEYPNRRCNSHSPTNRVKLNNTG
jgi:hypothetical protein